MTQYNDLLNTTLLYMGPGSGSNSVGLLVNSQAPQAWVASSQAPWLHPVNASGTGSATIGFAYDANPGATRTGTLTIAGQSLAIIQEGLCLGATNRVEGPDAGMDTVVLSSLNTPWAATANAGWLHLSAANQIGTGATNIVFSFDSNTAATRSGTLTIAGLTLTVTQAGSNYVAAPGPFSTLGSSGFGYPRGLAVDGAGNVYIADSANHAIEEWSPINNTISTLATNMGNPCGVAVDGAGHLYIADDYSNAIDEWSPASGSLTPLISSGLNGPQGVALDGAGNVYIADTGNNAIEEWSPANSNFVTLVSSGLSYPSGLAVDAAGNVYIADNSGVKEWSPDNTNLTLAASFYYPNGVAVDGAGNLYVAQSQYDGIAVWTASSQTVSSPISSGSYWPQGWRWTATAMFISPMETAPSRNSRGRLSIRLPSLKAWRQAATRCLRSCLSMKIYWPRSRRQMVNPGWR